MSKSRKMKPKSPPPPTARARRRPLGPIAVLAALVLVAAGGFWWNKGRQAEERAAAPASASSQATNPPTPAGMDNLGFAKLPGKWLRPDGGYILEIRSATPDGNLEAAYFNPRPIHVAKAIGSQDGGSVKVFVELRDVNYPGSTYTLAYDPKDDQLKGDYFQAALKQNFDVFFTRVQP